jgi:beta-glucosidase
MHMHTKGDVTFRALNKNGKLDPYEYPRRPIEEHIEDLLAQMTLDEQAGLLFHDMISMGDDGSLGEGASMFGPFSTSELVATRLINHVNVLRAAIRSSWPHGTTGCRSWRKQLGWASRTVRKPV